MASIMGTYHTMGEFKDEDRYLKLTKRQLAWALPAVALIFFTFNILVLQLKLMLIGIFLCVIIALFATVMMFVKMPRSRYLVGGGQFVQTILIRIILRRIPRNRIIYVKNYRE